MDKVKTFKIRWGNLVAVVFVVTCLTALPFINPCQYEDSKVCTWNAVEQGNGSGRSFTDFYGLTIFHF